MIFNQESDSLIIRPPFVFTVHTTLALPESHVSSTLENEVLFSLHFQTGVKPSVLRPGPISLRLFQAHISYWHIGAKFKRESLVISIRVISMSS